MDISIKLQMYDVAIFMLLIMLYSKWILIPPPKKASKKANKHRNKKNFVVDFLWVVSSTFIHIDYKDFCLEIFAASWGLFGSFWWFINSF